MGDFGAYLDSVDWGGGILAGIAVVIVGLAINWFLQASMDETLSVIPWLRSRIADAIRNREGAPTLSWICATCNSLNDPVAEYCYRGCGARVDLEYEIPPDEPTVQHVEATRRG
jgi:hypothetical protein